MLCVFSFTNKNQTGPYVLQHEKDIVGQQPGPHDGGGSTMAYPFFEKVKNFNMAFRKRVLHPGSSIGFHLQETDEVYYILSGRGEMKMNGETFAVQAGDAIHGLAAATD
jgi:mannose-6-phosphate isomerase-like protein (cupin superfamily)